MCCLIACNTVIRGGSKTTATSKMERFVIIVNDFQPLTVITKHSILDVAAVLDPPLVIITYISSYDSTDIEKCLRAISAAQRAIRNYLTIYDKCIVNAVSLRKKKIISMSQELKSND